MSNRSNVEAITRGARKLVEENARIQPGEKVAIIIDDAKLAIAKLIAAAAKVRGIEPEICFMPTREWDGQEPPSDITAAMMDADVIFSVVSKSITHTPAMKAALEARARSIILTDCNDDILSSPALLETDFAAQTDICRRLGIAFTQGDAIHLTSPLGTDLSFSISGRSANVMTGIPEPGELSPVPGIEVNIAPVEGTAEGRIVVDASVPYLGIGVLDDPIVCTIEDGYMTAIEGGKAAGILEENLNAPDDRNCFNVAELGVGLNPNARLTGNMLEDEGVLGTIHLGVGTSITLGGSIVAPTHYDLLMWNPSIRVDGQLVQQGRELLV
jgi:leucyl aminopeptidase (aminopeptidase T)